MKTKMKKKVNDDFELVLTPNGIEGKNVDDDDEVMAILMHALINVYDEDIANIDIVTGADYIMKALRLASMDIHDKVMWDAFTEIVAAAAEDDEEDDEDDD